MAATRTTASAYAGLTVCVLASLFAGPVSGNRQRWSPQDKEMVQVSYFASSGHHLGVRGHLADGQQTLDVLHLDERSPAGVWDYRSQLDRGATGLLHVRRRRAVSTVTASASVPETQKGQLYSYVSEFQVLLGRHFSLQSASAHEDLFEVTAGGELRLREGRELDYEDSTMQTITLIVNATSTTDAEDIYQITLTLTVTDVDEKPVFVTEPQPYLATVSNNSPSGYTIITLVAEDPEGNEVQYGKTSVSPTTYNDRIELLTERRNNVLLCVLRTVGTRNFQQENGDDDIVITVTARDASVNGKEETATVSVRIGVRPPQFYQQSYQGAMPEKNQPQQTVYKAGTTDELRVQWKTFQDGRVTLSLTTEGGGSSDYFSINDDGSIFCLQTLDYETVNPKTQALTLTATQRVGVVDITNNVSVTIQIEDTNDNPPVFSQSQYLNEIDETTVPGTTVLTVTATDADTGVNAEIDYSLLDTEHFDVVTETTSDDTFIGRIRVRQRLDYDLPPGPYYTFKVQATDRGTPPLSSTSNIRIAVRNVNDEHPQFTIDNGTEYRVSDVAQAGKFIAQIQATDLDGDLVSYSFDNDAQVFSKFSINRQTGLLELTSGITDADDRFPLHIKATDDGSCCGTPEITHSTTIVVYIQVYGTINTKPDFQDCSSYRPSVDEHSPPGKTVITVSAVDDDRGPNGVVSYSIVQRTGHFDIDSRSGVITVASDIDREEDVSIQVTVTGRDGGTPPLEGWCSFLVTINDINDNAPVFDKERYLANITVGLEVRVTFVVVRAYDDDVGNNSRITYSLIDGNEEGKFDIIPENGFIFLTQRLTEVGEQYSLTAMAIDAGKPPLNSTVNVLVTVKAGNTLPPTWGARYQDNNYTVAETVPNGYVIIPDMTCSSNIQNTAVEFQLVREDGTVGVSNKYFTIANGIQNNRVTVSATGQFNYLEATQHVVRIRCLNFGPVTLLTEINPLVKLYDTNNQIPEFQGTSSIGRYSAELQENMPSGTSIMTIRATDLDTILEYRTVTFSITAGNENFTITRGSEPNTAFLNSRVEFDRESRDNYFVTLKAEDGANSSRPGVTGPNTATVYIAVNIKDVNDNPPYFEESLYNRSVKEDHPILTNIIPAIPVQDPDDSDRGRHEFRFIGPSASPAYFEVAKGLGFMYPVRRLDYETGPRNFNLILEARDSLFSATTTVTVTVIDVNDNNPEFDPSSIQIDNVVEEDDTGLPRLLYTLTATDKDIDRPNNITYTLQGSSFNVEEFFMIGVLSGELYLLKALDRDPPEGRPDYQFTVRAADENIDPNYGYASVNVRPQDINDNDPEFVTNPLEASVDEHSPLGASVTLIEVMDRDFGDNGTVDFAITNIMDNTNVPRPDYFTFQTQSNGLVVTNTDGNNLDRESPSNMYYLTILLTDRGTPQRSTSGTLTVTLSDINDQPPIFRQKIYTAEMSEKLQQGEVVKVVADDADEGINAALSYTLVGKSSHFEVITIDDTVGSVRIYSPVDFDDPNQQTLFNLTVKAEDNAGHSDECYVEIQVTDFNDNAPEIQPPSLTTNVSEAAPVNSLVANFSATDRDSGINAMFEFSIRRDSDPRRHFYIDPFSGEVRIRRQLDRETEALHVVIIQAIDKGNPPQTGTATLSVKVDDVNDNYPTFLEDYQPQVIEEVEDPVVLIVQEIFAKDPDAPPYGAPFGFSLAPCDPIECDPFNLVFNPTNAGGNGTATVSTVGNVKFDRETKKYYYLPIRMWDMRGTGSNLAMTGTNTLTITIADINDNNMNPGTQNIFVYNYKGTFGPLDIGRVYVDDPDDWDLPDKTFTYSGAAWLKNYFKVNNQTGMVTMMKGVPSNAGGSPYVFTVRVYDRLFNNEVTSTVSVTVEDLSEEAVRNSGAVRLSGTSAEAFIKKPLKSSDDNPQSPFTKFQKLLAKKLNAAEENVQIISVQDVEGGFTDVRYSVHGSPYYPPAQSDSAVILNKAEFEQEVGVTIDEVPIDACAEEVFEGGCFNYMDITGNPALVNANGTSFVGVEVFITAREGCRALDFPDPYECSGDYCFHGGTCLQDDFGVLSCQCPTGFDGPRCQQLLHSFNGNSYAMYATLEQCEDSTTSIEFNTTQRDGLLFYNGPLVPPTGDQPRDFIALELVGGLPALHIDHGSGATSLSLNGRDSSDNSVIDSLSDGSWHKIEIVRKGKSVEMIVDDCRAAGPSGSEVTDPDLSPCYVKGSTPGANSFLNVATLLQVGGRSAGHTYPQSGAINGAGFNGCVRNLVHNSKYYDLHFKATEGINSGENGCPNEDRRCRETCGENGLCSGPLVPPTDICVCKPGFRGQGCSVETAVRDLRQKSYLQWQLKSGVTQPSYSLQVQLMYRTWSTDGVLFTLATADGSKSVDLELIRGRLQVSYMLGDKENKLLLNNTQASDGQWHVVMFSRTMHLATLTLDGGEGRNFASLRSDPSDSVYMTVDSSSPMFCGAIVNSPGGAEVIEQDLNETCIQDVRVNNGWLPIKTSENSASSVASLIREKNVVDNCVRSDGCVPPPVCPPNMVCHDLWGRPDCRCDIDFYEDDVGVCRSLCDPNPCFGGVTCEVNNGSVICLCPPLWFGPLCNIYQPEDETDTAVGIAGGTVAAIVVSIIVVIILVLVAFFLIMYYRRQKAADDDGKFVVVDDDDFDIRENVVFYDEEGAGEEDQNAFDLSKLPTPVSETMQPLSNPMRTAERPQGRRAPDDRPDVGDVLHDRLGDADDDPDAPPFDTLMTFADEGAGSDAGSLSSLGSSSSDGSQDYDYLNDWGPKFAKLADMYGAGQE